MGALLVQTAFIGVVQTENDPSGAEENSGRPQSLSPSWEARENTASEQYVGWFYQLLHLKMPVDRCSEWKSGKLHHDYQPCRCVDASSCENAQGLLPHFSIWGVDIRGHTFSLTAPHAQNRLLVGGMWWPGGEHISTLCSIFSQWYHLLFILSLFQSANSVCRMTRRLGMCVCVCVHGDWRWAVVNLWACVFVNLLTSGPVGVLNVRCREMHISQVKEKNIAKGKCKSSIIVAVSGCN